MQRIANGLRLAVAIAGEPPMNELHVPGVSISIIHGGVIQAGGFDQQTGFGSSSARPLTCTRSECHVVDGSVRKG